MDAESLGSALDSYISRRSRVLGAARRAENGKCIGVMELRVRKYFPFACDCFPASADFSADGCTRLKTGEIGDVDEIVTTLSRRRSS